MGQNQLISLLISLSFLFTLQGEESMVWYDGPNNPRKVYLQTDHVAVIKKHGAPSSVKNNNPIKNNSTWKVVKDTPMMTIYKVSPSSSRASSINSRELEGHSSPVYSEREGGDPYLVPIGGIIVYFKPTFSAEEVEAWAERQDLPLPARKLKNLLKHNAWVFDLPPGKVNLEKAKNLHADPFVVKVIPKLSRSFSVK